MKFLRINNLQMCTSINFLKLATRRFCVIFFRVNFTDFLTRDALDSCDLGTKFYNATENTFQNVKT